MNASQDNRPYYGPLVVPYYQEEKKMLEEDDIKVGEKLFLRTVTYHWVGEVKKVTPGAIFLEKATWVASSGRFGVAVNTGFDQNSELEYVGEGVRILRQSLVDVAEFKGELPTASS